MHRCRVGNHFFALWSFPTPKVGKNVFSTKISGKIWGAKGRGDGRGWSRTVEDGRGLGRGWSRTVEDLRWDFKKQPVCILFCQKTPSSKTGVFFRGPELLKADSERNRADFREKQGHRKGLPSKTHKLVQRSVLLCFQCPILLSDALLQSGSELCQLCSALTDCPQGQSTTHRRRRASNAMLYNNPHTKRQCKVNGKIPEER